MTTPKPATPAIWTGGRDEFIDSCGAFSLIVVVAWHWVFSIVYLGWPRLAAVLPAPAPATQPQHGPPSPQQVRPWVRNPAG